MKFNKTNPTIAYEEFYYLVCSVDQFGSLTGKKYNVLSTENHVMSFLRVSTGKKWSMNLKEVHRAYLELTDFKTINFKPYVPRTHSPALGLLIHLELLTR
ncbi:hypothetical protein [Sphingobacterium sp. 2149]|uniref:hypothetical protein n=1 Tax=Sphingobacterium sp. 2149 TaxID=2817763 RepID=UPI002861A8FA|nr:hypothetical protein [Sphingobacterium sp. 2149]MDR6734911.1 hypothetical protein [Sphingobacterium sp. 2149]